MKQLKFTAQYALLIFSTVLVLNSCKDEGAMPAPVPERIKLTLIDVAVREAYIHVAVANPAANETLLLQRNGVTVLTFATIADTNIADTGLTQSTTYQYTASMIANNSATGTSNTISTQTLAPTSHNFTWQTFLLGDGNGSALYDVALINDTLAYACGEIYLGGDPSAYNLARWNGTSWQLLRIRSTGPCSGGVDYPPLRAVWAFSATDILFTDGGAIFRYDGSSSTIDCRMNPLLSGAINKIYGFAANDVYLVAGGGTIVWYNGNIWQRLESGTTTQINDALGVINPVTGKEEVYCPVTSFFTSGDKKILRVTNQTTVDSIRWEPQRNIYSLWTNKGIPLFACGSTVHQRIGTIWRELNYGASVSVNAVRGTGLNDIVLVGDFGFISHYNGFDWQMVGYDFDIVYGSVALTDNMIVAVGQKNAMGIVTIGRKN